MNPKNVPRSERHHMIKYRCPLLPKPDFVLCHRFKGNERFKGHYGLKPFHYGEIQTKDMAEIDQTYKEKIREAEQKGPVYFVTHDTGNDTEAAKSNNLPSPVPLQIYDVGRGCSAFGQNFHVLLTSFWDEKTIALGNWRPGCYGEVTPVPHFICLRSPYTPDERAECFIL